MSVDHIPSNVVLLVVDTDQYSGNFERQLAGFMTGRHNETHGDREAKMFREYMSGTGMKTLGQSISDLVTEVESEDWPHVCTIYPTPGRLNNGMGTNYDAGDPAIEAEYKKLAKEDMRKYYASQIKMCQDRLDNSNFESGHAGSWTKEACERTLKSAEESIKRADEGPGYPAYESVAIFFNSRPSDEQITIMKERAFEWAKLPPEWNTPKPTIKGFRIIQNKVSEESC